MKPPPLNNGKKNPISCVKVNFDGATKGNPSLIGVGSVFNNASGFILFVSFVQKYQ